jgi:hypothetical protein
MSIAFGVHVARNRFGLWEVRVVASTEERPHFVIPHPSAKKMFPTPAEAAAAGTEAIAELEAQASE